MAKRLIFVLAVMLVAVLAGIYAYTRYRTDRRLNGGEVLSDSGKVLTDEGTPPVLTPTHSETRPETPSQTTEPAEIRSPRSVPASRPIPLNEIGTAAATDTIAPNPPNRSLFAGTGRFQVYRQGDLTWRVNTDTGSTCVLFATLEEWRKPIVYRSACGN